MAFQTTQRPAFGRRITPQAQQAAPARPVRAVEPVAAESVSPVLEPAIAPERPSVDSVDQDVLAWKEARGSQFKIPWRQIYLMASLCFGIASFVLPDSVNDNVDYLLWGLCAMSAYAWFAGRKKKAVTDSAAP
jgi:hypothetical protein